MRCGLALLGFVQLLYSPYADLTVQAVADGTRPQSSLADTVTQDSECSSDESGDGSSDCALQALQLSAKGGARQAPHDLATDLGVPAPINETAKAVRKPLDSSEKATVNWDLSDLTIPRYEDSYSGTPCKYHVCDQVQVGPSKCLGGMCICETGWRGRDGKCVPQDEATCAKKTGQGCRWWGCAESRGPTECSAGECLCKSGFCAIGGRCDPVLIEGSNCSEKMPCNQTTLGPTSCEEGSCVCAKGHAKIQDRCEEVQYPSGGWHWGKWGT
eukprot:TRINITY_DN86355_c0_g1_i1.p1 TRINITY_DN86355_c0_g1~~TRINITY_DN86355_c0_g1_i1.p1  ORF type:complete len:271 (-),score=37.31 TRINITY_DN86355_c0_g1_i1:11-823(-)